MTGVRGAVAIVTQDEARRRTLMDALAAAGFDSTGAGAPRVFLIDAEPDGLTLCRRLRAKPSARRPLVAVVCRAAAGPDVALAAFASGADALFREPLDPALVAANLAALVRLAGTRAEADPPIHDQLRAALADRDAALARSADTEARLWRVVEGCPAGIIVATADRITEANRAFLALLGYTSDDVHAGRVDWRAITPREYAPLDARAIAEVRERGECTPYEKEYFRKDGMRVPVLIGGRVLRSDPLEVACFVLDMTDRRREREVTEGARRTAEEANRAKDHFLAMLSHELRTPLAAVVGWTRLLRQGRLDTLRTAAALESIERATQNQIRLINDLLDVSRIVAGKLALERERLDLVQLVDAATATVKDAAEVRGVHLVLELPREALVLDGAARRLDQVVWNLLDNAVKFTPEGGRIEVRLERDGDVARLCVSDTGRGIAAELLPRVFDRFCQGTESGRRTTRGLGLGLAIARHVVEAHGGGITAASEGDDLGSIFTVTLPLATSALRPVAASEGPARRLDGVRVLAVDDDEEMCVLLGTILEGRGARVRLATSAKAAREALDEMRADVLICDIEMPGDDGYALIGDLRRRAALLIPALALTAHARVEDRPRALEAGFDEHMGKPFEPDVLVATLAALIDRGGRRSAA